MGVLEMVGAGRIGLGGGEGESSGRVVRRGGAKRVRGEGTERYDGMGMRGGEY